MADEGVARRVRSGEPADGVIVQPISAATAYIAERNARVADRMGALGRGIRLHISTTPQRPRMLRPYTKLDGCRADASEQHPFSAVVVAWDRRQPQALPARCDADAVVAR